MIKSIHIKNFKCLREVNLDLSPLTLLCGLNGMGKSSVIQALLMIRQSLDSGSLGREQQIELNGDLVSLGTGKDVLYDCADSDRIDIELRLDRNSETWRVSIQYSETSDQLAISDNDLHECSGNAQAYQYSNTPPFGGTLLYAGANRIGPLDISPISQSKADRLYLGDQCVHALNCLSRHERRLFMDDDPRCIKPDRPRTIDVIDDWLHHISPGVHLEMDAVVDAGILVSRFSFDRPSDIKSRQFRATNVGFGISFVLPVLVALLTGVSGHTLSIIENPESHLHPRGQTRLGELAVRTSLAGVQVIAETHSDHFLDGIRIAVRNGLIRPDDVVIHYFTRQESYSEVESITVDSDGRLSNCPEGFFDEFDKNLIRLF